MNNLHFIDAHFTGKPHEQAIESFNNKIESDPAFAKDVADYITIRSAIKGFAVALYASAILTACKKDVNGKIDGTPVPPPPPRVSVK